ncbi:hypothetical protein ACWD1Y_27655 [Streptomyces sp. NPDC002814]
MRTQLKLTRDGDAFIVRLTPRQVAAMYEALSHLSSGGYYGDTELTLLVGAGREPVEALVARLAGRHTESRDFRLTIEELHMVHSALTAAPTMFGRDGLFAEEPFHIRLGFYRENFYALASAVLRAVAEA